jgi:hypothetical protein
MPYLNQVENKLLLAGDFSLEQGFEKSAEKILCQNKNLRRQAIDSTSAIVQNRADSGSKFPTDRARLLCLINPTAFNKQNKGDELD